MKLILEAIKFNDGADVIIALQNKQTGCKVDPTYKNINDNIKQNIENSFDNFFKKCESLGVKNTVYGVQFLLGHTNPITLKAAVNNDAIYEFLKSANKPWVKELPIYNKFINSNYNADVWHEFEKTIQDESRNHGKVLKGSGNSNEYKTLYDDGTWKLMIPNSFEGEKAIAYFGKKGEPQQPTHWCTRANKNYYDHYTENGPLYVIRNFVTGRAYQLAFMENEVCFLDQDDVKGDEITKGDLTTLPDNLLKLIKHKTNGTLLDFKTAPENIDPKKEKDKRYVKNPQDFDFKTAKYGKERELENGVIAKDVLNFVELPRNKDELSDFFNKDFVTERRKSVDYQKRDKATVYCLKSNPEIKILYTASKGSGVNGGYSLYSTEYYKAPEEIREKIENIAAKDFGVEKNLKRLEKFQKEMDKKDELTKKLTNNLADKKILQEVYNKFKSLMDKYDLVEFYGSQNPIVGGLNNVLNLEVAPKILYFKNNKGEKVYLMFVNKYDKETIYRKADRVCFVNKNDSNAKRKPVKDLEEFKRFAGYYYRLVASTLEFKELNNKYKNKYDSKDFFTGLYESYFDY